MLVEVGRDDAVSFASGEVDQVKPPAAAFVADLTMFDGSAANVPVRDGVLTLPAIEAPNRVTVTWLDGEGERVARTVMDIATANYFELGELKGLDEPDDFSEKTDGELSAARAAAVETFELNANRSFVGRVGSTMTYDGGFVSLDHCDVWGIQSPDGYRLVSDCQAVGPDGAAEIVYRYGANRVPQRVHDAVLQLAAYYLRDDLTPDRATGEATEAGFLRYTIAGRDGATGLPEVDAVIEQFGRKRYGAA